MENQTVETTFLSIPTIIHTTYFIKTKQNKKAYSRANFKNYLEQPQEEEKDMPSQYIKWCVNWQ